MPAVRRPSLPPQLTAAHSPHWHQLLQKNPDLRLGSGADDADAIRAHHFFAGVNWADALARRLPPPMQPVIQNPLDTSNFDEQFTEMDPLFSPTVTPLLSPVATQVCGGGGWGGRIDDGVDGEGDDGE